MKHILDFINEKQNFLIKGHTKKQDYIDLDLPSGIKWATCNIGADKPEDYGLLFQWGRTDGYKYNDKNHKFLSKDDYTTTSGTEYKKGDTLKPEDDAAYQATNGKFRMPTVDEIDELLRYTNNEWTELNGVEGQKFISKKDNSKWIFIPAAGYFDNIDGSFDDAESVSYVWITYAPGSRAADYIYLCTDGYSRSSSFRYEGQSVRGVLNK